MLPHDLMGVVEISEGGRSHSTLCWRGIGTAHSHFRGGSARVLQAARSTLGCHHHRGLCEPPARQNRSDLLTRLNLQAARSGSPSAAPAKPYRSQCRNNRREANRGEGCFFWDLATTLLQTMRRDCQCELMPPRIGLEFHGDAQMARRSEPRQEW